MIDGGLSRMSDKRNDQAESSPKERKLAEESAS